MECIFIFRLFFLLYYQFVSRGDLSSGALNNFNFLDDGRLAEHCVLRSLPWPLFSALHFFFRFIPIEHLTETNFLRSGHFVVSCCVAVQLDRKQHVPNWFWHIVRWDQSNNVYFKWTEIIWHSWDGSVPIFQDHYPSGGETGGKRKRYASS